MFFANLEILQNSLEWQTFGVSSRKKCPGYLSKKQSLQTRLFGHSGKVLVDPQIPLEILRTYALIFISCQQTVLSKFLPEDSKRPEDNLLQTILLGWHVNLCGIQDEHRVYRRWTMKPGISSKRSEFLACYFWEIVGFTTGNSLQQPGIQKPCFPKVDKCGPLNDFTLSCNPKSGRNKHSEVSVMVT